METSNTTTGRIFTNNEIDEIAHMVIALKQLTKKDTITCVMIASNCINASYDDRMKIESKIAEIENTKTSNPY